MEPPEIRDQYIEYAKQERENHAKAHPEYKFCPSKTDASRRKRKGAKDEPDDDKSVDFEEHDFDWHPSKSTKNSKGKGRAKKPKPQAYSTNYSVDIEFQDGYEAHGRREPSATEQSSFEFNNPGRDCPPRLDGSFQQGEYYQSVVSSNPFGTARVDDVSLVKAEAPQPHYEFEQGLVGLPGSHHDELLDQERSANESKMEPGIPLDPQLDPLYSTDFDLDQIGSLDGSLIFNEFDQAGLFDDFEIPQPNPDQEKHQNEAEHTHRKSPQNDIPNANQSGYDYVYDALYQQGYPNEDEDGLPNEYADLFEEDGSYLDQQSPAHKQSPEQGQGQGQGQGPEQGQGLGRNAT